MSKTKTASKKKILSQKALIILISIVTIIAIIASIIVISSAKSKPRRIQSLYTFDKKIAQGIDVSEHNGKIDWQKIKETQDFAFIRVGYRGYGNGSLVADKYVKENLEGASAVQLPVGVYFYTQAINEKEAAKEADFVYDIIRHYNIELPVIIDFEYPADNDGNAIGRLKEADLSKDENTKIINSFIEHMQKKGYISGVYASSSFFARHIDTGALNENSFIWVADYNSRVTFDVDYTVWQYSQTGKCNGNGSEYVDLNYWYE